MTDHQELDQANEAADQALAKAKRTKTRAERLLEGWRKSRSDDNFLAMVKQNMGNPAGGR